MSKTLILFAMLASLTACSPQAPGPLMTSYDEPPAAPATAPRVRVVLLDVIHDSTAYNSMRGVYLITDTATGKEFIGVSGIGISEVGSHSTGKTSTTDER